MVRGELTRTASFAAYRIPSCNFVCIYSLMGCVYVTVIGFGTACVHSGWLMVFIESDTLASNGSALIRQPWLRTRETHARRTSRSASRSARRARRTRRTLRDESASVARETHHESPPAAPSTANLTAASHL